MSMCNLAYFPDGDDPASIPVDGVRRTSGASLRCRVDDDEEEEGCLLLNVLSSAVMNGHRLRKDLWAALDGTLRSSRGAIH